MRPFTVYYMHHSFQDHDTITKRMTEVAAPLAVYLLGGSLCSRRSESIFNDAAPASKYVAHCFYLVLMPEQSGKTMQQWEDQLEQGGVGFPFTVLALEAKRFANWLQEAHPFACAVRDRATLLYQRPGFCSNSTVQPPVLLPQAMQSASHTMAIHIAREFLAGAELYVVRKTYRIAALMLHQAAEQSLRSVLLCGTGYTANMHSVDRLLRYAALVSWELLDVFNTALAADKKLLGVLQKAYIGSRYEPEFCVKGSDLEQLMQKVQRVVKICEEVGTAAIAAMAPPGPG